MTVEVRIPSMLQKYTGGARILAADGATVGDVIAALERTYPGIRDQLLEDGAMRRFVNIFLNDEDIRFLDQLNTRLADGDSLAILPALAGG